MVRRITYTAVCRLWNAALIEWNTYTSFRVVMHSYTVGTVIWYVNNKRIGLILSGLMFISSNPGIGKKKAFMIKCLHNYCHNGSQVHGFLWQVFDSFSRFPFFQSPCCHSPFYLFLLPLICLSASLWSCSSTPRTFCLSSGDRVMD